MPHRKPPSCVSPAGIRHFYRNADLHGLRLALWEDDGPDAPSVANYLREAGASVEVLIPGADCAWPVALPPMIARHRLTPFWSEESGIRLPGAGLAGVVADARELLHVDVAVLNLRDPAPLAASLQSAGIPFVMFTQGLSPLLADYAHACYVPSHNGPEALASAVLLHTALYGAGLQCTPEMTVMEMMPRLRAMARYLVQDGALADDLVADALEQALGLLPHLASDREIGALLVTLIERIWHQQKMSRPN
ncbi:hypothetical protein SAMN05421641_11948 [Paracoccus thiocyanatus]|uniref:Uncharacterized protein n=1 Tax=Paracoccus thiocyanatus TaxID=34006 RepID=A0A1N6X5B4_9RHOB|nr:hypothetical protein [Paracoccus thiocyanatus]SIQ97542.1 hypothetical protein SAMN05421641_11948 [Paracoccus thiocyanatus]